MLRGGAMEISSCVSEKADSVEAQGCHAGPCFREPGTRLWEPVAEGNMLWESRAQVAGRW